jgi:hypothetical protein
MTHPVIIFLFVSLALFACSTPPRSPPSGSSPVDVQRTLLEEQSATLDGMKADIASIRARLAKSRALLDSSLQSTGDLERQFDAIDAFVRAVIDAERRLETLQNGGGVK